MATTRRLVYVVDDDTGVRKSMTYALSAAGFESRPFVSGEDFLEELPHLRLGCVLLDIRMRQMNGLQVLDVMRKRGSRFPVVVMTGHGDIPTAVEAMKLGADDFIEKPFAENAVLRSLEMLSERLNARAEDEQRLSESTKKIFWKENV